MALHARGELTTAHVRAVAQGTGVSVRTVWNWLAIARLEGRLTPVVPSRAPVPGDLRARLALWGGNVAAVHRELAAEAAAAGERKAVPSLRSLQRAVQQELSAGERAGWRSGEAARRGFDVYGKRPPTVRNACWEGDHKRVPVQVRLDGQVVCPWVTWFIDVATKVIVGVAVTPHQPGRDAVLAALRTGISRTCPFGPFGGLPARVRVDRGKEFLCRTVYRALSLFAVTVDDLPAYTPYRKGTIESLNGAVERMLFVAMPGYTRRARAGEAYRPDRSEDLLPFEDFVQALLDWVAWWNTEHHPRGLTGGRTPQQAWNADPAPIEDVPEEHLAFFALEDDGRARKITTNGVSWQRRAYIAPWMTGHVGTLVRLRYLPHFDGTVEVFAATGDGHHLGTAYLAETATPAQQRALSTIRTQKAQALKADLKAAEKRRRTRYTTTTTPSTPTRRRTPTTNEAQTEIDQAQTTDLAARALPDLIPPREPPATWARPRKRPPSSD
ncbi:Mu transposase C-terminal domain-containing protein [Streptomyces kunmingensis]|uniref:Mu transposase C-terminal domain-containing protein n=1 Tax=Streptomyces kunmingensis TaxID=68225 RepID=A0ABU6C3I1_9ACTN|nr:Mu transposase C-terminal domain-containing protein [Streptomyces kunmingensis]MEB3959257.1 Mu transposase C-terminal domain-containing protein [Streptomyces kunmingensis]